MNDKNDKNLTINITTGTFVKCLLAILLVVFLYLVRDIAAVILLSVVLASGVEPAACWFQKYRIPRVLAVIFVYLITFCVLVILFYLVVPTIFSELSDLVDTAPFYLNKPFEIKTISELFPELPKSISSFLLGFAGSAKDFIKELSSGFFQAVVVVFGGVLSFFLIIVLSFYMSVQEKGIENFLRIIAPIQHEKYVIDLWLRSREKIGGWLKGQVLLGILVGILVFLGLTILQIKYALTLALLAAVFDLIPIFGPILASIPAIGFAFLQSPTLALEVMILYIIIQQFENHLIYPLVVRKVTGISPVLTILALVIGAKLGGFFGIILSIPITAVFLELLYDYDVEKKKQHV
jgi:predicted PurR-regulated permease PerM